MTKAGKNEISVRFYDGVLYSEAVTIEIYAHTVSFDTRGGSGVKELYKAVGDKIALSEPTKDGYNFAGWYNTPTGPKGNGAQYADETFSESGDIVLYAYWTPVAYDIVYDYDGGSGEAGKNIRLPFLRPRLTITWSLRAGTASRTERERNIPTKRAKVFPPGSSAAEEPLTRAGKKSLHIAKKTTILIR